MKRCANFLRHLIAALALLVALPSCATAIDYSAESIEAWVVDADTGAPVQGAVVVAHWQLMGGMEGGNIVGQVMVLEAVTDGAGRFYFPAWGPVRHSGPGRLDVQDPGLIIFKSGYKFLALANDLTKEAIEFRLPPHRKSKWNGKTIPMKNLGRDLSKIRDAHSSLGTALNFVIKEPRDCLWKKVPVASDTFHNKISWLPEVAELDHPSQAAWGRPQGCGRGFPESEWARAALCASRPGSMPLEKGAANDSCAAGSKGRLPAQ